MTADVLLQDDAPRPADEQARLATLLHYDILDTPPEREFDDIVHVAAALCQTPIALVSLVDADRQWFKSRLGLDATETPRGLAFCGHAILGDGLFEVPNALEDERFRDNPPVTGDPDIRFYAGAPLTMPDGQRLGTLCVIDRTPRQMSEVQRDALMRLGRQVARQVELRHAAKLAQGREAVQRAMVVVREALAADEQDAGVFEVVLTALLQLARSPSGRLVALPPDTAAERDDNGNGGEQLVAHLPTPDHAPHHAPFVLALYAAGTVVGRLVLDLVDPLQARDLTERLGPLLAPLGQLMLARRAAQARAAAERLALAERLRGIASQIPGMVYQYRLYPDGRHTIPYASARIRDIFGAEPTDVEIPAQPVFLHLHVNDIPGLAASIERSMTEMQPWHQEYRVTHPTRGELWVEGPASPQRLADGSILWHGFATDITGRRETERALADKRLRMDNVIEAADLGTGEWRFDTGEVVLNERWAAQLGFRLEELQPTTLKTWMDRLHPDDVDGASTLLKQHLRGDSRYYEVVLRLRHRDGHWVSSHSERGCLAFPGSLAALEWVGKPLDDAQVLGSLRHLVSKNPDRRARVLHVEDDADLRQVIGRALAPLADVDGAGSIEAARTLLARREYDLMLLDLSLPDGDGWQLFRQWQISHPDLPVVVLSATELTPAQFSQARAVLAKSRASPEQFLATLENLLPHPAPRMEAPA